MAAEKAKEIDDKIEADAAEKEAERQAELEASEANGGVVDMEKQEEAAAKKMKEDVNKLTAQAEENKAAADAAKAAKDAAIAAKEADEEAQADD